MENPLLAPAAPGALPAFDRIQPELAEPALDTVLAENRAGRPNFERMRQQDRDHEIERVGAKLRAMMPWSEEAKAAAAARPAEARPATASRKPAAVS